MAKMTKKPAPTKPSQKQPAKDAGKALKSSPKKAGVTKKSKNP
jgi:hypothetical protein